MGLVTSFRDVPYVDSHISWLAPTPGELPQHTLIHSAYLQAILGTSASTHRIEQKGKLPYTACHKTLSSSVFAPGSVGPGMQTHSRLSPSRYVLTWWTDTQITPWAMLPLPSKSTWPPIRPFTHSRQPTTNLRIETKGPKVHAERLPHRDDLWAAACGHGSI